MLTIARTMIIFLLLATNFTLTRGYQISYNFFGNGWHESTRSLSKIASPYQFSTVYNQVDQKEHRFGLNLSRLRHFNTVLKVASADNNSPLAQESTSVVEFTPEEQTVIENLYSQAQSTLNEVSKDNSSLQNILKEALPTLAPSLIIKLKQSLQHENNVIRCVAVELENILQEKLLAARQVLQDLLNAGEIRKLDSLIGQNARAGKLDVAFFNVLTVNLRDALAEQQQHQQQQQSSDSNNNNNNESASASRAQILQHIYTRCQEEVEKTIPPGTALLNKLLRTEQEGIRVNLYKHYLTPQLTTIKSPDGKEIELKNNDNAKTLISLDDFVEAIAMAVKQIRTIEQAGGTNKAMAADMVESCRQVAKEARIIIGESYGRESSELLSFEDGLQPVFRPVSPDSPYIKGE